MRFNHKWLRKAGSRVYRASIALASLAALALALGAGTKWG